MPELELFSEALEPLTGYFSNKERGLVIPMAKITEVQDLIFNGYYRGQQLRPHEREFLIREALTLDSFPLLFGDVLDRQVLANYQAAPSVWKQFTKLSTVPDFRNADRYRITGGDGELPRVVEKAEYQASNRTEARYRLAVLKYGRQYDVSWETMINDDLGALKDTPQRFALAASRTEHRIATGLYVHNVILATGGRGNLTANLLTVANLETALEWYAANTNAAGDAIVVRPKFLVVPPALEMTARAILTSTLNTWVYRGDTDAGPTPYPTQNIIPQMGLQLVVDPYITILDATAAGTTGWYLFSPPNELAVTECAYLRGHERPEIVMKASDKVSIGGGAINPMAGDFATDNVFYRVRVVFGGVTEDWRGFYFGGHTA